MSSLDRAFAGGTLANTGLQGRPALERWKCQIYLGMAIMCSRARPILAILAMLQTKSGFVDNKNFFLEAPLQDQVQ